MTYPYMWCDEMEISIEDWIIAWECGRKWPLHASDSIVNAVCLVLCENGDFWFSISRPTRKMNKKKGVKSITLSKKCTQNMNVFSKIHKRDIICSHFYANGHILTSNCISCCCGMYVYCGANLIKSNAIHIVPCVLNVNVKNLYFHIALSWNYFFFLPSIFFMPLPIPLTTLNMLWKDR